MLLNKNSFPNQAAFLPTTRQIYDIFLVAKELIHNVGKKIRKSISFVFKVDMSKAHDRSEWPFLMQVPQKFRLPPKYINLLCACVCTPTIGICIIWEAGGSCTPKEVCDSGVHSLLFILCLKVFSSLSEEAELKKKFEGMRTNNVTPSTYPPYVCSRTCNFWRGRRL